MRQTILSISIILSVLCASLSARADIGEFRASTNQTMNRLLSGCLLLKHGVESQDVMQVALAVDSLNTDEAIATEAVKTLKLGQLRVTPVNTDSVISTNGAFRFSDSYGREWMGSNDDGPIVENPSQNRDTESLLNRKNKCNTLQVRLLPHSNAIYTTKLSGLCHIFMIGEPSSRAILKLETDGVTITPEEVADDNLWLATWEMPAKQSVKITITNDSDTASTILLAAD